MAAEGETDGEMPQRAEASIERLTSSIVIVVLYDFFSFFRIGSSSFCAVFLLISSALSLIKSARFSKCGWCREQGIKGYKKYWG